MMNAVKNSVMSLLAMAAIGVGGNALRAAAPETHDEACKCCHLDKDCGNEKMYCHNTPLSNCGEPYDGCCENVAEPGN